GKTLLHGDVLMWLMKTLLTSGCTNQRGAGQRDAMQSLMLPPPAQHAIAKAALTYRFGEEHQPVTESQILSPRRWQDESNDLWTTYQRIQENLIKGGLSGRTIKGKRAHTRAVKGIDGDVKLNRALWVMAENMLQFAS
ncbi:DUF932 domain-containing protein, partial [Enterobacter hormaechei]|uniref:DUF932 domain-containing protein n=1 Tax=Enterobacter hormaechei TaxID=158836 RepID=UPI001EDC0C46